MSDHKSLLEIMRELNNSENVHNANARRGMETLQKRDRLRKEMIKNILKNREFSDY